ncbi:MAG: 2-amino-4-hydroxy-6-hydroxymethyldihydropteridine diphosphokinase [Polyangiaceae bacterium]|nr:2-amino-4-hydroxy-6-hydroxymethyldihydropteridine diphosphokinase [Polyangiaceae bacterium]
MYHIRRVVIGLGSNVGDRLQNIAQAVDRLRADQELHVAEQSPLYETKPEGGPPQGDYLNGAVLVLTAVEAPELLRRIQRIEAELGRVRAETNGPRTIDLDILWIEGETIKEPDLVIPHARLSTRAFMLKPLLDVASDARDAETGMVFAELPLAQTELKRV